MNDKGVLIVKSSGNFFTLDSANILFDVAPNDHNLPLATILGDASIAGAPMTACLQKHRLVLAFDEHAVLIFDGRQLRKKLLLALFNILFMSIRELRVLV